MSQTYSVVVILRAGQWTVDEALGQLAPVLQPGIAEPSWETERVDPACVLVPNASTTLPGVWWWMRASNAEFDAAVWRPSATSVHRGDDTGMKVIDQYLSSALTRLRPAFEYFSILSEHAERAWLEKVCAQLHDEDWNALLAPAYERMLLPPHLGDRFIDHPQWRVLEVEDAGVLVQTREL